MLNFLKKLQASDEGVKQRWLIASSAILMAIVIFLWLGYFNALIQPVNAPPPTESADLSFWQTFKTGLGIISENIKSEIKSWLGILKSPKDYIIQP